LNQYEKTKREIGDIYYKKTSSQHAVVACGFSLGKAISQTKFLTTDARMDKIYVHDDQIGPFAEMLLDAPEMIKDGGPTMTSPWAKTDEYRAMPDKLLFPLHKKIRVPYDTIYEMVEKFSNLLDSFKFYPIEWDIYLTTLNTFRSSLISQQLLRNNRDLIEDVLTTPAPRFMYRATALINGKPRFDLLFDATDIRNGQTFLRAVFYEKGYMELLSGILSEQALDETPEIKKSSVWPIITYFRKIWA
jgi:hypothetical protein